MNNLTFDQVAFVDAYCNAVAVAPRSEVVRFLATPSTERGSREFYDSMSEYYGSIMDAYEIWFTAIKHARTHKGMTVGMLSDALANLPKHLPVMVWDAGNRVNVSMVDDSFINDEYPFVDINTTTDD